MVSIGEEFDPTARAMPLLNEMATMGLEEEEEEDDVGFEERTPFIFPD